jgi:hypothetical protein
MLSDGGRMPARNVFSTIRRFETPELSLRSSSFDAPFSLTLVQ